MCLWWLHVLCTGLLCICLHMHAISLSVQTEKDISVRQRAIDLLYAMCDHSNAKTIVEELLQYLETADYSIRETLVSNSSRHLCVCGWVKVFSSNTYIKICGVIIHAL